MITVEHYYSSLQRNHSYQHRVTLLHHKKSVALVKYLGNFPEHVACHGNSKSGGEYVHTAPQDTIATECSTDKPKAIYTKLITADNNNEKPMNLKQVENMSTNNHTFVSHSSQNFADKIQKLISQVSTDEFVQAVFVTKSHTASVVLYRNEQIINLQQFCSSNASHNIRIILAVDRTFDLTSLFVTVTVFKHRAVVCRTTNDCPIFLIPVLLHGDGNYTTYRQLLSHIHDALSKHPCSTKLRVEDSILTGLDEEHATVKALKYAFPHLNTCTACCIAKTMLVQFSLLMRCEHSLRLHISTPIYAQLTRTTNGQCWQQLILSTAAHRPSWGWAAALALTW